MGSVSHHFLPPIIGDVPVQHAMVALTPKPIDQTFDGLALVDGDDDVVEQKD